MTTVRYNASQVNSRHLVAFTNNFPDEQLYYFDFESEKWIKCYPINKLPYNLCSFRLENDTNENCVVTSLDSYRLTYDLTDVPYNEEMREESEWRDEIVNKGAELDFIKGDKVYKAKVCWTKSDIIPGVMLIGPRTCPNLNSFGYYYKESKNLAKSCTYTDVISEEQLKKEQINKINYEIKRKEQMEEIKNIKRTLDYFCPKQYLNYANKGGGLCGKVGFYNLLPFYQTLKIYPEPITLELVKKLAIKNGTTLNIDENKKYTSEQIVLLGTLSLLKDGYDGGYGEVTKETEEINGGRTFKKCVYLNGCEAFFDIKIYNATYAHLSFGDKSIELEEQEGIFTLTDINLANPLFCSVGASGFRIFTDGDKASYKCLILDSDPRRILYGFDNSYAVSYLHSKNTVLLVGNMWQPSIICTTDELVKLKDETLETKEEKETADTTDTTDTTDTIYKNNSVYLKSV